jgi:hypothetical protein
VEIVLETTLKEQTISEINASPYSLFIRAIKSQVTKEKYFQRINTGFLIKLPTVTEITSVQEMSKFYPSHSQNKNDVFRSSDISKSKSKTDLRWNNLHLKQLILEV